MDREKVIKGLEHCSSLENNCADCPYNYDGDMGENRCLRLKLIPDALELLKGQEAVKQKMWNALYADEDKWEKKFVGTSEHDDWFCVYRPWLQRGFGLALKAIVAHEERLNGMTKQDAAKWLELDYLPRLSASRKDCANGCDVCRGMHQTDDYCDLDMLQNVLALLKEQETTFEKDGHHITCKSCGAYWCDRDREGDRYPQNFCPNCGKVVKRND